MQKRTIAHAMRKYFKNINKANEDLSTKLELSTSVTKAEKNIIA